MEISASVSSSAHRYEAHVETDGRGRALAVPKKATGGGSAVNGGELLFLALATCYCNDVYREAAAKGLRIDSVNVRVSGRFAGRGLAADGVVYDVHVRSPEPEAALRELLAETDRVAEVHNSLRERVPVELRTVSVAEP